MNQIRVLMIDDNPTDAFLIQEILTTSIEVRYDVENSRTLSAAIQRVRETAFDVVLLDLSLPDSWGYETFARLRVAFPDLPVIIMSGSDDPESFKMAIQNGAQDYFVKGEISKNHLRRSIWSCIHRKRFEEDLKLVRKAVESIPLGVIISDSEGQIVYCNGTAAAMHQSTPDEMKGGRVTQFIPSFQNAAQEKTMAVCLAKDGSRFPVTMRSSIVTNASTSPYVVTILEAE